MADSVEVDPDALSHAADLTENLAGDIRTVLTDLRARLGGVEVGDNQPWGNDKMGHTFTDGAQGYISSRDNLLDGTDGMASVLDEFADGMRQAVESLTTVDLQAAENMPVNEPDLPGVPHKVSPKVYVAE